MKKYSVSCVIGGNTWDIQIKCDYFIYSESGVYYFSNSETGDEWYFPIRNTVIIKIK